MNAAAKRIANIRFATVAKMAVNVQLCAYKMHGKYSENS